VREWIPPAACKAADMHTIREDVYTSIYNLDVIRTCFAFDA
jgi:hypothetical protein